MTGPGPDTLARQARMRPSLARKLARNGHDLLIVRPGQPTGTYDDLQQAIRAPDTQTSVRGFLYQLDAQQAIGRGAQVGVPLFEAILPWDTDVTPGFWIEYQGRRYTPEGVANDYGNQQVAYGVTLSAPENRGAAP